MTRSILPRVRKTLQQFIADATNIHGDKYDYSQVEYHSTHTKIEILCREHGLFIQEPNAHLHGHGCPKCGFEHTSAMQRSRVSHEDFIRRAKEIHGDKYDYSLANYSGSAVKVEIICPVAGHGSFWQTPNHHAWKGTGCPKCKGGRISHATRKSNDKFVADAIKKHGDKFDYSLVDYTNCHTPVEIICRNEQHGSFLQTPNDHLKGKYGCPKCARHEIKGQIRLTKRSTHEQFISKAKAAHGDRYDYSLSVYVDVKTKVKVICSVGDHGVFMLTPGNHIRGGGCPKCAYDSFRYSTSEFIRKAKEAHGDFYDYSLSVYKAAKTKIEIICPVEDHGSFWQDPTRHINNRQGCPKCKSSNGEIIVSLALSKLGIPFERQKGFDDLKYKSSLKLDFFLDELNTAIEYNGLQHFFPVEHFGGAKGLINTQMRDRAKRDWCAANNMRLIEIPYTVEDVPAFLREALGK